MIILPGFIGFSHEERKRTLTLCTSVALNFEVGVTRRLGSGEITQPYKGVRMSDVLPQPPEDVSIARAGRVLLTPPICTMGEDAHHTQFDVLATLGNGRHLMMGDDPRLPKMPAQPRLVDFFRHRFVPMVANHLLQSARLAKKAGLDERVVMACLLHDIAMAGLITSDHGYWGAQLIEPYVDEEVSWAVRHHQALRYFPDEAAGYSYPQAYIRYFGEDYQPPDYLRQAYEQARRHKWYMTSRLVTVNGVYAFDPNIVVGIDDFEDVIGRHFRQPEEGLGFDNSPVAHMWRTMIWPRNSL
jgi:HD domain